MMTWLYRPAPLFLVLLLLVSLPLMGLYSNLTSSVPSGTIVLSNSGSCPSGFAEVTAMRGYHPVGLVPGGTSGSSHGTALTLNELRAAGAHSHTTTYQATADLVAGAQPTGSGGGTSHPTDVTGSPDGVAAPYYYVQFCSKS